MPARFWDALQPRRAEGVMPAARRVVPDDLGEEEIVMVVCC